MRDAFYGFLELPVGGRFTIILSIVFILYCIFGRLLYNVLSLVPFLLKKLTYGLYLIIEIPISALHKSLGGVFSGIDQGIATGFGKLCSVLDKCYGVLHNPQKINIGKAFFIFLVCAIYLIFPTLVGLNSGIFTFWENSYIKNERKLVKLIEATSLLDESIATSGLMQPEVGIPISSESTEEKVAENDDYILSFSSTRALTEDDLKGLSKEELRLARNEIFARNGRQFREEELRTYFESKSWYQNMTKLPLGTEPNISKLEESNALFIREHE